MKLIWFLSLIPLVSAKYRPLTFISESSLKVYACHYSTSKAVFCEKKRSRSNMCVCTNPEAIASTAGCLYDLDLKSYPDAATNAIEWCSKYYKTNITNAEFAEALAYYKESSVDFADVSNYTVKGLMTRPVRFSKTYTMSLFNDYHQMFYNYNLADFFGFAVMGYWMLILFIYSVNNWVKYLFPSVFIRSRESYLLNKIKRYIVLPTTFGNNKQHALGTERFGGFFNILMPSRVESVVLVGYLAICLAFLGADMEYDVNNPIITSRARAMERYLADRSGIVGTITIPLLVLFGGRNNLLQWITGINFATFITYHKWMARIVVGMIIIHSVCYSLLETSYYSKFAKETYIIWGILGTVAGSLIVIQSLLYFRRKWYETFLVLHIILAVFFIVGAWVHVVDLGYIVFMYITIGIWVFDRVVRIGRLILFGFPRTNVKLINGDLLKLEIPTSRWWTPTNGGFGYVYFLSHGMFFQSHPYTYVQLSNQINFYIKVKEGITQKLQSELLGLPDMAKDMRITVEGPYGGGLESCNVKNYHRAVFLAGGNGIPGLFSEAMHLGTKESMKQQVKLIWVIRDYNALNWFWQELMLLEGSKVEVDIYVTRPETYLQGYITDLEENEEIKSKNDKESNGLQDEVENTAELYQVIQSIKASFPHISFHHSRPDIEQIISDEIQFSESSVAIVACGHPKMVDEAREMVSKTDGKKRVDFYEHLQVWA